MSRFNSVSDELIGALTKALGEHGVKSEHDAIESYKTDQEGDPRFHYMPGVVVFPESTEDVAAVVKLANKFMVPITPRSGGTSVSRGAIPVYHGIVMDLTRMNKIITLDADNLYAVVQPGVYTSDLQAAAREKGLMYAGDPCSATSCMIGGNVATNAGGDRAVKYGVTRDQIYAMKIVTANGEVTTVGQRTHKNTCGYALEQLMIGSEGTLGIITEITVKLLPEPTFRADCVAIFDDNAKALRLPNTLRKKGVVATSMEYLDYKAIKAAEKFNDIKGPYTDDFCVYIIMTIETYNEDDLDKQLVMIDETAREMGAKDVLVIEPNSNVWTLRKTFGETAREMSPKYYQEDFVVPIDKIIDIMEAVPEIEKKYNIPTITCAHIGDGNLHTALMNEGYDDETWENMVMNFHKDVYPLVYKAGGSMSGEHGIGFKRLVEFKQYTDPVQYNMMLAIKKALDPNDILNPGILFDVEGERTEASLGHRQEKA